MNSILRKTMKIGEISMEEAKRKLRNFLICVVMSAVLLGIIYYFTDVNSTKNVSDGTLVYAISEEV